MAIDKIPDPVAFFNSFSLHDVNIERINLDFVTQTAEFATPDLNWNYESGPDHIQRPCLIRFLGTKSYMIDVDEWEGVRISHVEATPIAEAFGVEIHLSLGVGEKSWKSGQCSIRFVFDALEMVDT